MSFKMFYQASMLTIVLISSDQVSGGNIRNVRSPYFRKETHCNRENVEMFCGPIDTITMIAANYGRTDKNKCSEGKNSKHWDFNCTSEYGMEILSKRCNGKPNCFVDVNEDIFGDPCFGTDKYLDIIYECDYKFNGTKRACEGETLIIDCPEEKFIEVLEANYGRTKKNVCGKKQNILECVSNSSNEIVKNRCNHKTTCSIPVGNELFGDPCEGTDKYLSVTYRCMDSPQNQNLIKSSIACDTKEMDLKCSSGEKIEIVGANYGRTDPLVLCTDVIVHKNVNCVQKTSKDIVSKICNSKSECKVQASKDVFGDPCEGTDKYLKVYYLCRK